MQRFDSTGSALDAAARRLRQHLGDATAPVAVLAPMHLNNAFARRALAEEGPQIRLYYFTPESLVRDLSTRPLARRRLQPESAARRNAFVSAFVDTLAERGELGGYTDTLRIPGWKRVLAATVERLEAAGLTNEDLSLPEVEPWIGDRLRILAALLRELGRTRAELRLAGPLAIREAALAGLDDPATPCNEVRGVILLGDRDLSATTFEPVRQWLERRPHMRIALDPVDNAPVADALSIRALGKPLETFAVAAPDASCLGHLQRALWQDPTAREPDDSVRFVRTPDEVRENEEVVRFIQRQIAAGVALDRIAIILPDDAHREPLAIALERASIPATWFVTASLADGASARFLLLALEMAAGRQGVDTWYDLLRQRRLRLRAHIGALPAGRGRWRRLLATCGAHAGGDNIVRALRKFAASTEDEADRAGAESLALSIETISRDLDRLRHGTDLGRFAGDCLRFVDAWWRHSADRAELVDALRRLQAAGLGIPSDLDASVHQLRQALEGTPIQDGYLSDAAVRVLPPMAALGSDFDVVCVLGVVQGRLPRRRGPDPVLSDPVVDTIERRHRGTYLRRDPDLVERRRFAAAVSAARRVLWVSIPAFEGLAERPRIPSVFALDALATQLGRRASYRDLDANIVFGGSLAHPYPRDPHDALGPREYLVSGLAAGERALAAQLTSHAFARNLLRLHLDLGGDAPLPRSVQIDPERFRPAALDGEPLRASDLAHLVSDPGGYFYRRVLGAYSPRALHGAFSPLQRRWIEDHLAVALAAAADTDGDFLTELQREWDKVARAAAEFNDIDQPVLDVVIELGRRQADRLATLFGDDLGVVREVDAAARVADALPWLVELGTVRLRAAELLRITPSLDHENTTERIFETVALAGQGYPVESALSVAPSGTKAVPIAQKTADAMQRLALVTTLIERGFWPWGAPGRWTLAADAQGRLDVNRLRSLTEENAP